LKGWSNHPIKLEYLNKARKRIVNTNPKSKKGHPTVWGWVCEQCNKEVSKVEIDHAGDVQGKFTCMDEIQGYAEHLYLVDFDSLQCVCLPCHKIRSYAQKQGLSFDEAAIEKEAIRILKWPIEILTRELLSRGYTEDQVSNAKKRKKWVILEVEQGRQFL